MEKIKYDLAIIGAGPGGYVAAIKAAQFGKKVVVIEKKDLGGVCLNWGCIPTKSLLRSGEIFDYLKTSENFGLFATNVTFDFKKIIERSRHIAEQLSSGIEYLLKKNNINILKGIAHFDNKKNLIVKRKNNPDTLVEAEKIIIATGAKPKLLSFMKNFNNNLWSYYEALSSAKPPSSLGIIGSGAIGIEFASFFNSLGSKVKVFEVKDKILPSEDSDVSKMLEKILENKGIKFLKNTEVCDIEENKELILKTKKLSNSKILDSHSFDKVLVAVGVEGNTDGLGLEKTNIKKNNGHIKINSFFETDEKNIFAIGDVVGAPWLAHKASHEGLRCIELMFSNKNNKHGKNIIPSCIYSHPQVASVGITEDFALKNNMDIKVGNFPLSANGKALSLSEPKGFVKTIFCANTGELLGAHMLGAEVTELINSFTLAMKLEATEEDIFNTIFPHPTISESIHESSLNAFGKAIHI